MMDKRCANILLLSDKECEYQTLVNAGYKNVFWFKSSLRAYEYFKTRENDLKKFDVILMGSRAIAHFDRGKYGRPFSNVTFYSGEVEKMSFFAGYSEEEERMLYWISYPNVTSVGVSEEEFLSILDNVIPDKLKGEVIEIPEVKYEEIILPKKRDDVKVLFMGYERNRDLVESVFQDAGFINFEFIKSTNFSLEENVDKLSNYDLVVVDQLYNGKLSLMGDEFQDYMKDKGKIIYFDVYKFRYKSSETNEFSTTGFITEDPSDKRTVRFKSMESEDDALRDLMGIVINGYCYFNHNMGDGGYPNKDDLNQKYEERHNVLREEERKGTDRICELAMLQRYLNDYRTYVNRGIKMPKLENIKIDVLQDGVSVAFLVGNREGARITFKDEDKRPMRWCDRFYLEYLSEKGKLLPARMRRYYFEYYDPSLKIENLASEEEMKKVDAIYNRVCEVLKPVIDKMKDKERAKEEQEYKKKKYNKKYSESSAKK